MVQAGFVRQCLPNPSAQELLQCVPSVSCFKGGNRPRHTAEGCRSDIAEIPGIQSRPPKGHFLALSGTQRPDTTSIWRSTPKGKKSRRAGAGSGLSGDAGIHQSRSDGGGSAVRKIRVDGYPHPYIRKIRTINRAFSLLRS